MKKLKNVLVTLLSALMILTLFVGCSDDSAQESDALGYVSFSDGGSRGLETENRTLYGVEDLYWAYTAEKVRGNYTTGQSEVYTGSFGGAATDVTDGVCAKSCLDGTKLYKLTPVKQGPAKGLAGAVLSPFSVGEWRIKLYGFKGYNAADGKFTEIIYKGTTGSSWVSNWSAASTTVDDIVTIDKRSSTDNPQILRFSLSGDGAGLGELDFRPITLTVPEHEAFYGPKYGGKDTSSVTPKIRVIVLDMRNIKSGGIPKVIAVSTTPIDFSGFTKTDSEGNTVPAPELAVFTEGQIVKTASTVSPNALNTFVKVKDDADPSKIATKTFTTEKGGSEETGDGSTGKVTQFKDGIANIAFLTFYQDYYTVGQNTWTLDEVQEANRQGRYDYEKYERDTDGSLINATGDLTSDEFIQEWFKAAGKMRLNNDDSITTLGNNETFAAGDDKLINGWALVGNIAAYPIGFTSGVKTTVGGDLNDLLGAKGETEEVVPGTAVARINWKVVDGEPADMYNPHAKAGSTYFRADNIGASYTNYTSLEDAIKDYDEFFNADTTTTPTVVADCVISPDAPYIQLLANIEDAKLQRNNAAAGAAPSYAETTHETEIMLVSGDHFIRDLEITSEGTDDDCERTVTIIPSYDATKTGKARFTEGYFSFSNCVTQDASYKAQVLRNFQFKTDIAWIYTEPKATGDPAAADPKNGGTLIVDGTGYVDGSAYKLNVTHSGIASNITVTNVNNADGANKGYLLAIKSDIPEPGSETTNVGNLTLEGKGRVDIGGGVCVNKLTVSYDTAAPAAINTGDVVLNARSNAVVWQYGYVDYSGSAAMDYVALRTATYDATAGNKSKTEVFWTQDTTAAKAGFKEIVLNGNNGTHAVDTGTVDKGYMYGIKGLGVELPQFYTSGVGLFTNGSMKFMNWNTVIDDTSKLPTGTTYGDKATFVPTAGTVATENKLYAVFANPVGGRIFDIAKPNSDTPAVLEPALLTYANYRFYGASDDGSVKEIRESDWKVTAASSTVTADEVKAQVKKLESAVYMLKKSDATEKISVVWTETDPASGVTADTFVYNNGTTSLFTKDAADTAITALNNDATANRGVATWEIGTKDVYDKLKASGVAESIDNGNLFELHSFWTSTAGTAPDPTDHFYVWKVSGGISAYVLTNPNAGTDPTTEPAPTFKLVPVATI